MASIKISELEEVVTLSESDTLPITNEGDTKQVAISKLGDILATKEYVNKTVGELADMGFTPIIVESLPTENIQTNTIYMILGEDGEGENIYEEWMYINNAWEKVGSTGVSGGDIVTYVITVPYQSGGAMYTNAYSNVALSDDVVTQFNNVMTEAYFNHIAGKTVQLLMVQYTYNSTKFGYRNILHLRAVENQSTYFNFIGSHAEWKHNLQVNGSWSDNIFTVSSVKYTNTNFLSDYATKTTVLTKTNTTSYTPSANYHPATKKYVDDSITSAITTALESDY